MYSKFDGLMSLNNKIVDNVPVTIATVSTAGVVAYTAAQFLNSLILRDCNGAGRADTVPTAAALLTALTNVGRKPNVGAAFELTIRNASGGAFTITLTATAGVTISGTATIAQNNSKKLLVVFTDIRDGNAAYTLYSLGTFVH